MPVSITKRIQVPEPDKTIANGSIKSSKSPKLNQIRRVEDVVTTQEESPPIYKRPPLEKRRSSLRGYPQVVFPTICEGHYRCLCVHILIKNF